MHTTNHHLRRRALHEGRSLGERAADRVASTVGSWRFIIIQSAIVAGWISLNLLAWSERWDPYPFILLNLAFSTQAAYAAPILQMSGNRSAAKDRATDDLEAREVAELHIMNTRQLQILDELRAVSREQKGHHHP